MIEGFGDEVLTGFAFLLFFFIPLLFFARNWRRRGGVLPENQQNVDQIRPFLDAIDLSPIKNPSAPSLVTTSDMESTGLEDLTVTNSLRPQNFRRFYSDSQCPICLNNAHYPVETNCGHMFCGNCLCIYWRHGRWGVYAMTCPVCRQTVSLIIPCFSTNQDSGNMNESLQKILAEINSYNRRFSDMPRSLLDYLYDLPVLLRHAVTEFFSVNGLMLMFRVRIVLCFLGAILYLATPFDIIPEAIFGLFGLFDDMLVLFLIAIYASITYRQVVSQRATNSQAYPDSHPEDSEHSSSE